MLSIPSSDSVCGYAADLSEFPGGDEVPMKGTKGVNRPIH
jgi:hypothetical protein